MAPRSMTRFPTEMFTNGGLQNLLFTNSSLNLLGVGWLEIPPETNLYNTVSQDLITYSLAHETVFTSAVRQCDRRRLFI